MDYPKSLDDVYLHEGKFTDGTADGAIQPSRDPAEWANAVTDEILAVQAAGGLEPEEGNNAQMALAINNIVAAAIAAANGFLRPNVSATLSAGFFTAPVPVAIAAGHAALDLDAGNVFTIAVNASFTLDIPAELAGKAGMMLVVATQDGVGGHGLTLAAGYHLSAGDWSTEAGAVNLLWITSDGGGTALDVVIAQRGA